MNDVFVGDESDGNLIGTVESGGAAASELMGMTIL